MKDISQIKVVSIDLFRTLVPLPQSPEFLRRWYLDGRYPPDLAQKIEGRGEEILARRWDAAGVDDRHFLSVRTILLESLSELFEEIRLGLDAAQVTDRIMAEHRPNALFEDALPFLRKVGAKYPLALSSDCDLFMLEGIRSVYPFDKVFASEDLRCYKLNPRFFLAICETYAIGPAQLMHIGDSQSDIVVPARLGVTTCWLNRKDKKWAAAVRPDYEVKSLMEILEILGL